MKKNNTSVVLIALLVVAVAVLMMRFWDRPIQRFFSSRSAQKANHGLTERGK